jgi:hypothetical protein
LERDQSSGEPLGGTSAGSEPSRSTTAAGIAELDVLAALLVLERRRRRPGRARLDAGAAALAAAAIAELDVLAALLVLERRRRRPAPLHRRRLGRAHLDAGAAAPGCRRDG